MADNSQPDISDLRPGDQGNPAAPGRLSPLMPARSSWRRRLFRLVLLIVLIAVAFPAILGLVYSIEGTRPVSMLMLGRWITGNTVDRQWVEIEDVAPVLLQSVIMSEDGQFCAHRGVDLAELNGVIDDALEGEKVRGASTITMQTAKNLFLWNDRSFLRKAAEIPLAVYLDGVLSKRRIMEIYINIAEWDEGVFGIEAAARHHFGRSAVNLTPRQAALLTVTLPAPLVRNPAKPGPGLQRLAALIERRAQKSGGYTQCVQ